MKKILVFVVLSLCLSSGALRSQDLSGLSARWSDSFVEWDLYGFDGEDAQEERIGSLQLRWLNLKDDFSEWEYQCGSQRGSIRLKWKDDPNNWELRTFDNETITMRTLFNGDLRQWRVTNNDFSLELRSKWQNQLDEWLVEDRARGVFLHLYAARTRPPRLADRRSSERRGVARHAYGLGLLSHFSRIAQNVKPIV